VSHFDEEHVVLPPAPIPVLLPGQPRPAYIPEQNVPEPVVVVDDAALDNNQEEVDMMPPQEQGDDLLDGYMQEVNDAQAGPDIRSGQLVDLAHRIWEKGEMKTGSLGELMAKYPTPGNLKNVSTTSCNTEIFSTLARPAKIMDARLRYSQQCLATATVPILQAQDDLLSETTNRKQLLDRSMDAFTMISAASKNINQLRRELIKPNLDNRYQHLCAKTYRPPEGPLLFGLVKNAKASQEAQYLTKKRYRQTYKSKRTRSSRYQPYKKSYRRRTEKRHSYGNGPGESPKSSVETSVYDVDLQNERAQLSQICSNDFIILSSHSTECEQTEEENPQEVDIGFTVSNPRMQLVSEFGSEFVKQLERIENTPFQAGEIRHHLADWQELTSDFNILQTVNGMHIDFIESPVGLRQKYPIKFSKEEIEVVKIEIENLLTKKVIEKTHHCHGEVISNIFTREKRDSNKHRVILNLSLLNESIEYCHFKMDTLNTALNLLTKDCFCASIDLADAYYSVNIAQEHRKFLRFEFEGILYQFTCLPNGLSPGPRIFTKLLKPALRCFGVTIMPYLDDLLL